MTFLDKLLARDEHVLLEARRHPIFMLLHAGPYLLGSIVLWIVAVLAIVILPDLLGIDIGLILSLILLAVSVVPLIIGIYRVLNWWREQYVVTSFRIIQVEGLMNRKAMDSALEKVNDVIMTQSVFGRIFNYGSINIVTGSDAAINDIAGVSDPFGFKKALMQAKMDFGSRGVNDDGFPTRRATAAETSNRNTDTDRLPSFENEQDHSRAVIALTELRNSGVISDAEFDDKLRRITGSR